MRKQQASQGAQRFAQVSKGGAVLSVGRQTGGLEVAQGGPNGLSFAGPGGVLGKFLEKAAEGPDLQALERG